MQIRDLKHLHDNLTEQGDREALLQADRSAFNLK
ncbi:hypothetical protein NIES806_39890 [Dolichospermum compactum NIES-806]|jgi:hypothetical protein|uniref:Uncharacterized protein n=1 Tax=Dolichospermum compactum NIES-806 TaxID=1973481 RepID=A0A1Z4V8K0_9CYAN|nr:hypothetical protein NIES806_39890 [Dolichospermum compactum NIES-806]